MGGTIYKDEITALHEQALKKLVEAVRRYVKAPSLNTSRELVVAFREYEEVLSWKL